MSFWTKRSRPNFCFTWKRNLLCIQQHNKMNIPKADMADPSGLAVWDSGLRPLAFWDCGFEFHRGDGCLSLVTFVLSGRVPCVGMITLPEEFYRVWCVRVWTRSLDNEEVLAHKGCCAMVKKADMTKSAWVEGVFEHP